MNEVTYAGKQCLFGKIYFSHKNCRERELEATFDWQVKTKAAIHFLFLF